MPLSPNCYASSLFRTIGFRLQVLVCGEGERAADQNEGVDADAQARCVGGALGLRCGRLGRGCGGGVAFLWSRGQMSEENGGVYGGLVFRQVRRVEASQE